MVIVAAARNISSNVGFYPAALSNVIAVSAIDSKDGLLGFSNFGNWISVGAPGTYLYTTTNGGGYGNWQDTSFASPQVAALATLLSARNPSLTKQQVVDLIKNNADDTGATGFDSSFSWGRINAFRSVQAVQSTPNLSVAIISNNSMVAGVATVIISAHRSTPFLAWSFTLMALCTPATRQTLCLQLEYCGLSGSQSLFAKVFDVSGNTAISSLITVSFGQLDTTLPDVHVTNVVNDGKSLRSLHRRATRKER